MAWAAPGWISSFNRIAHAAPFYRISLTSPPFSRELWKRCHDVAQERYQDRNTSRSRAVHPYPLTPLLRCAVTGINYYGNYAQGQWHYRDRCADMGQSHDMKRGITFVLAQPLEDSVGGILHYLKPVMPDDWKARALSLAADPPQEIAVADYGALRADIEAQIRRVDWLLVKGRIDEAQYASMTASLQAQLPQEPVTRNEVVPDIAAIAALIDDLPALWAAADHDERRHLARSLFRALYIEDGHIVAIDPMPVLWRLLEMGNRTIVKIILLSLSHTASPAL